jgi:hypothetical protein
VCEQFKILQHDCEEAWGLVRVIWPVFLVF